MCTGCLSKPKPKPNHITTKPNLEIMQNRILAHIIKQIIKLWESSYLFEHTTFRTPKLNMKILNHKFTTASTAPCPSQSLILEKARINLSSRTTKPNQTNHEPPIKQPNNRPPTTIIWISFPLHLNVKLSSWMYNKQVLS